MGKISLYAIKVVAVLFAALLPFAVWFGYIQGLPPQLTNSIMGTVSYKVELLKNTPGPRIILVGGSSSPFGTNCELIEKELGMPVINVGATAYIGADFYINMLEKYMQPNDIIVFGPEHSMLSRKIEYSTIWSVIENHYNLWDLVPTNYWPEIAKTYYRYAEVKQYYYKQNQENGVVNAGYNPSFGPLGDVTMERVLILENGYNTEDPITLSPEIVHPHVVKSFNNFYKNVLKSGAQAYFIFAPVNQKALISTELQHAQFEEYILQNIAMPILMPLEKSIIGSEYFYDTNNHLNTVGADIYSADIVQHLKDIL